MDYTSSNSYATDGGTAQRMHLQAQATPTAVSDTDLNGLTWEAMAVIKAAGLAPAAFDKTVPATYTQVRDAIAIFSRQQTNTAFTTTGTAPNFVLTPTLPIAAYTANMRFRVGFNVAGSGANAINVSALGAKLLKQYDTSGAKVPAVIAAGQLADIEYDGVDFVVLDPLPPAVSIKQIQPVTGSVAANALTCTLSPTALDFRSNSLTSGAVNTRTVAAAISVVVPSTATLGSIAATLSRLVLLAIDNAGTVELAVVNIAGGNNLDETTLISTTSISAAATAANVIYSMTARASVPFRVVGYVESTQTVAGTWATAPSTIQGMGGQALAAMSSLGYGQTWQAVTRTNGVTYYNTTGKPILLFASFFVTNGTSGNAVINSVPFSLGVNGNAGNICATGTFVIPVGASYSLTGTAGFNQVNELR